MATNIIKMNNYSELIKNSEFLKMAIQAIIKPTIITILHPAVRLLLPGGQCPPSSPRRAVSAFFSQEGITKPYNNNLTSRASPSLLFITFLHLRHHLLQFYIQLSAFFSQEGTITILHRGHQLACYLLHFYI